MTTTQQAKAHVLFLIVIVVVVIVTAVGTFMGRNYISSLIKNTPRVTGSPNPEEKACTADAKLCPDGSAVGRTGPNCEFAPCPIQL